MPDAQFQFSKDGPTEIPKWAVRIPLGAIQFVESDLSKAPKGIANPVELSAAPAGATTPPQGGDPDEDEEDEEMAPVMIAARSGEPISHEFWGKIVHDMAGVHKFADRIPLDYAHKGDQDPNHVIGYADLNGIDLSKGGLMVPGMICTNPDHPGDVASQVLHKMRQGIPYQASINWGGDGIRMQAVAKGEKAHVNGYEFEGPGVIARNWPLRSIGVCMQGADVRTATSFTDGDDKPVTVNIYREAVAPPKEQTQMSQTTTPPAETAPAPSAPPAATPPAVAPPAAATAFSKADFVKSFGEDKGLIYFGKDMSFADATAAHMKFIGEQNTAALKVATDERDAIKAKLDALPRGNDPAAFSAEPNAHQQGGAARPKQPTRVYSDGTPFGTPGAGLHQFAAGLKLPNVMGQQSAPATTN